MVKSTVNHTGKPARGIKYPVLAKSLVSGDIILFTSVQVGTVVFSITNPKKVGRCSDNWVHITRADTWEILPDGTQIVLTQVQGGSSE